MAGCVPAQSSLTRSSQDLKAHVPDPRRPDYSTAWTASGCVIDLQSSDRKREASEDRSVAVLGGGMAESRIETCHFLESWDGCQHVLCSWGPSSAGTWPWPRGPVTVAAPASVALLRESTTSVKTIPRRTILGARRSPRWRRSAMTGELDDAGADGDREVLLVVGDGDWDGVGFGPVGSLGPVTRTGRPPSSSGREDVSPIQGASE